MLRHLIYKQINLKQIKTDWIECVNLLLANTIELGDVLQLQCSLTHEAP